MYDYNNLFSSGYFWPILIGVFIVAHIWMMFRGHGGHRGHSDANTENKIDDTLKKQPETKNEDNKQKHDCCH